MFRGVCRYSEVFVGVPLTVTQTEEIFTLLLVIRELPPFWRFVIVQYMVISTEMLL
jgi:hypothetical protein